MGVHRVLVVVARRGASDAPEADLESWDGPDADLDETRPEAGVGHQGHRGPWVSQPPLRPLPLLVVLQ